MESDARILLVGSHAILMGAIAARLEYELHLTVVDLAATPQQAADKLAKRPADILLMDIDGSAADWSKGVETLRAACHSLRIILLGSTFDDSRIDLFLKAGVSGFLVKDEIPAKIGPVIREVLSGGAYVPENVRSRIIVEGGGTRLGDRGPANITP